MRYRLLAEITIEHVEGGPTPSLHAAQAALSLMTQYAGYTDKDNRRWKIQTLMHTPSQAMLGKREVCASEGHVIPPKPTTSSFGCARCDFVFTGKP